MVIRRVAFTFIKAANYMQRGGPAHQFTGAKDRQSGFDYRGQAQRNLDADVQGTYLAGGYEDGPMSHRERKSGLHKSQAVRSTHKHLKKGPAIDTASSGSPTWSNIVNESRDPE